MCEGIDPIAVASQSLAIKMNAMYYAELSGSPEAVIYMCHDFGARGVSSWQTGYRGSAMHLLHFDGSDSIAGDRALSCYYGTDGRLGDNTKLKSILASEHSVATIFGKEDEKGYVRHLLNVTPDHLPLSVVGDSYDIFNFASAVLGDPEIAEMIRNRKGRFVLRPDSGDPLEVVPRLLDILGGIYGYTVNEKGYKVINNNVGIIQGDGMNRHSINELYKLITNLKWSSDNLVVGSGGGLLQKLDRDVVAFAIKCNYAVVNGHERDVVKTPVTDNKKASISGYIRVKADFVNDEPVTYSVFSQEEDYVDELIEVYRDGEVINEVVPTIEEMIDRTNFDGWYAKMYHPEQFP